MAIEVDDATLTLSLQGQSGDRQVARAFSAGDRVADRYVVVRFLAEGGMGEVYEAAAAIVDDIDDSAPARAGCASFPVDGADLPELLARARAAADEHDEARITHGTVRSIEIGGKNILVADPAMSRLYGLLQRLASSDLPVLIQGETGVGKEAAATFVHAASARSGRPFLALNCATVPENLAESELFGYDKGAFSGAASAKPGLLESASGGTIFLDEVGELSLAVQAKLLRVVESRKVMRLGEVRERPIDIRIVAATNRDLEEEVGNGRFRQDLFFRLSTAIVRIPPLRERPRELLLLARKFLEDAAARMGRPPPGWRRARSPRCSAPAGRGTCAS